MGLFFVSKNILPTYSPKIPIKINCMPADINIAIQIAAHPATHAWVNSLIYNT